MSTCELEIAIVISVITSTIAGLILEAIKAAASNLYNRHKEWRSQSDDFDLVQHFQHPWQSMGIFKMLRLWLWTIPKVWIISLLKKK